ncbi:hypothetical protein MAM1_0269c08989 [Mucor ambiguus]|uniref:Uncharacterized protein n=1 Tax=Mucor ambiguus TaxID=91626 RepID=A0A0C9LX10_9FUNG|nr:hypothetical protein MAM1_0269c08989 [Mucor ambiguus]
MSTSQEQVSEIERQLSQAKKNNVIRFRNELLLKEILKVEQGPLSRNLDEAIKLKYNQVSEYITASTLDITTMHQTMIHMNEMKSKLRDKQANLGKRVADYVKTILEMLDVTWTVIEQFKYKAQKDKNITLDDHYAALVDAVLLKTKILQLSILIGTYDDPDFIIALETLRMYD